LLAACDQDQSNTTASWQRELLRGNRLTSNGGSSLQHVAYGETCELRLAVVVGYRPKPAARSHHPQLHSMVGGVGKVLGDHTHYDGATRKVAHQLRKP
jgi:hypothetical protein